MIQKGTEIVLSSSPLSRHLINIPPDVKRWKIKYGEHYPTIFLLYPDGIERRVLCPVGADCMEPGFILQGSKRGTV